ncbi:MAG: 3-hydroxybutyryl-CoA dehydrogenase [Pseudomonadales bacterium]|nr:3-hydroxybutyryl-CoA dehydrogenase [Pseudomonadales bacterium]
MSSRPAWIAVVGAGRMGEGIALAFAMAGVAVRLIDARPREAMAFDTLAHGIRQRLSVDLDFLAREQLVADSGRVRERVTVHPLAGAASALAGATLVFEAVPEVLAVKRDVFAWLTPLVPATCCIASTTSTLLVDTLADGVDRPERFLNAHWLNPAHLMPLVELSYGRQTSAAVVDRLAAVLESIGKVATRMGAAPGYVVPRLQALVMNEAARMVEEGVGTAEEIDKAVRVGFGLRFAVLGLLEFIDWGGGDILYYASRYLQGAVDAQRYALPDIVARNMQEGRNGLRDGQGFYDYRDMDTDAYREARLRQFVAMLRHLALLPASE